MVNCSAFGCKSRSEKKEAGISFHSFPKDVEKCKTWLDNMKLDKWEPTKFSRICSKHFEERYLYQSESESRIRLLNEAIPTIFPELPKHLQPKQTVKRARSIFPEPGPSTVQPEMQPQTTESPQKTKLRMKLLEVALRSKEKTRKIRVLTQSLKRYKKKVVSLKNIIQDLKRKKIVA
ncbi:unnamed protein product [Ceutorhynchus assimilis]|uniref:THAP-type domain-containing protein n=1 Tax=Ceutorhynchus assimilis TaxID=467358 RepID=A0A9N9MRQ7_9CUCU|nr:unnamed protein product [Ceutorhynchus assimilis]